MAEHSEHRVTPLACIYMANPYKDMTILMYIIMPFGDISSYKKKHARKQKRDMRKNTAAHSRSVGNIQTIVTQMAEKKFWQTGASVTPTTTSFTPVDLSAILQQTTLASKQVRVGDVITPTSLRFGYLVANVDSSSQFVRVIVVQWFNEKTPDIEEILQDAGPNQFIVSSYAQNLKTRFKVLYDKRHTLNIGGGNKATADKQINKLAKIRYDAGAVTGNGKIWMFAVGTAASGLLVEYYSLLRFIDM